MDRQILRQITQMRRNASDLNKVMLILEGMGTLNNEVPDPYYGTLEDFETIFHMLHKACLTFIDSQKS